MKKLIVGLLLLLLISGCDYELPSAATSDRVQPEATGSATSTSQVITTIQPAILTQTPTILPSPTATATPMNTVQSFCPSIEPLSSLPEIEGQLIMNGINPDQSPDLSNAEIDYLLDLKTGDKQSLLTKSHSYIGLTSYIDEGSALVSPDRSKFAYVEYGTPDHKNPVLKIINSAGEYEQSPNWGEGWDRIYGWADNQTLLFITDEAQGYARTAAVRPFEEGATNILEPPPNLLIIETGWYFGFGKPVILYNSGLKRAVYFAAEMYPEKDKYTLWDPITNQVLWQKPISGDGFRPVWDPDGKQFAVAAGGENEYNLFLVSEEGKEQQLTDLSEAFGIKSIITTGALDWAPDGQYLAFWVQKPGSTIAYVDVETKAIKEYCIEGQPFQMPVWSPDGKWLALNSPVEKGDWLHTRVILLNIITNRAYELIRNDTVIGWMQGK